MTIKHILYGLILVATLGATKTTHAQNFGYLNSAAILADMPEIKVNDATLGDFQKQLQKRRDQMVTELRTKYEELDRKQQSGEIAPKILQEEAEKLKGEEAKIGEYEQQMTKEYSEKRDSLFSPILDKVNQAIKDVSKEGGYQYIFDYNSGVLLYADETKDVSNLVRAKLGMPPAAPKK